MTRQIEAWTPVSTRPVRTFNVRDLAEAYKAEMEREGTQITIRIARLERRVA